MNLKSTTTKIVLLVFIHSLLFAQNTYYEDKLSQFEILNKYKNLDTVMIGDSITSRGLWSELLDKSNIANRGIDGDTTDGLLNRIQSDKDSFKKVFLMIGINDLLRGKDVETIFSSYKKIISFYKSKNTMLVVQSTLHVYEKPPSSVNEKVKSLNILLEEYCKNNSIVFLDINKELAPNGYLNPKYTNDRLHLNGKGYEIWANALKLLF